ncbi:MAG: hypothetical protein EU541_03550 [Promethearchaeota archaeon]|nr:MAG: hypothetical protein EU541_03550 [Candidatus Lokiarchaeota archaeon]
MYNNISPLEFNTFLVLTVILIITKLGVILYLGFKIYQRKKEKDKFTFGFIFSVFIMMICLFLSRVLFFIFDFYLTELDPTRYFLSPNVYFWKVAVLIMAFGYACVLFVIDKRIIDFKFKGILAYIVIIASLIMFFYPVNSQEGFEFMSIFLFFINIIAVAIPILFLYIGTRAVKYRRPAIILALGVIIYAIGANILNEAVVAALEELIIGIRFYLYFITLLLKMAGIILYSYGVTEFTMIFSG